jgi:hypothetical protein
MPTSYRVTATALNLRSAPDIASSVLAVLRSGQVGVGGAAAVGNWLPLSFGAQSGWVSSAYVQAVGAPPADPAPAPTPAAPAPASPAPSGPAVALPTDPAARLRLEDQLHPRFRALLDQLLQKLAAENRPFRVFEAFRTPERQEWLYAQGRTRPGGIVTKAGAWKSFHQFGLAADLVLFIDGNWSWDDAGPLAQHWTRLRELASEVGLRTLSFEVPHVELPVELLVDVSPDLLSTGDEDWLDTLASAADRWRDAGRNGAPSLTVAERPPMAPASST